MDPVVQGDPTFEQPILDEQVLHVHIVFDGQIDPCRQMLQ